MKHFTILKFPPIPRIRYALQIRGIGGKLRKRHIISRQKAALLFNRVETSSQCTKQQKVESNQLNQINSCCITSQTFIISYLTCQSSTFKTLIKKNEKS